MKLTAEQQLCLDSVIKEIQDRVNPVVDKAFPGRTPQDCRVFHSLFEAFGMVDVGHNTIRSLLGDPRVIEGSQPELTRLYEVVSSHAMMCLLIAAQIRLSIHDDYTDKRLKALLAVTGAKEVES